MASKIPPFLILAIFSAILGMFQFGFNTGVINAPQVSYFWLILLILWPWIHNYFQAAIEAFIGDAYKARYDETMDKSLISTIFSIAVNAFVVGGMIGGLSGGKFAFWL